MSMARKLRKKQKEQEKINNLIKNNLPENMSIMDAVELYEKIHGQSIAERENHFKINISDDYEYITANEIKGLIQLLKKHPKKEDAEIYWIEKLENLSKGKNKEELIEFITDYNEVQELYEYLEKLLQEGVFPRSDKTMIFTDFDYAGAGLHGQLGYIDNFVGFRLEQETEPVYSSRQKTGIQFDEVITLVDAYRYNWDENARAILGAYFEKAENMLLEVVYQNEDDEDFEAEEHEYYEYLEEVQSL